MLVLALSNDGSAFSTLAETLGRFPPESAEANLAVFALEALGLFTPDLLPKLTAMLAGKYHRRAINYLMSCGGAEGRDVLVAYLARHQLKSLSSVDEQLALILANHENSRGGALGFLRQVLGRGWGFDSKGRILALLACDDDANARANLYEYATQRHRTRGGWYDAIRFIAEEDPDEAFTLAVRHLDLEDRRPLPSLLMRIDPVRGMDALLHWLPVATSKAMRGAAARALRWSAAPGILGERLTVMADDASPRVREVVAEVIGWQPSGFMADVLSRLIDDRSQDVESMALTADRRHREQMAARELLEQIPGASNTRRWSLLLALLDVADPRLLVHEQDPLFLRPALAGLPPEYALWADDELDRRLQKVESDERT